MQCNFGHTGIIFSFEMNRPRLNKPCQVSFLYGTSPQLLPLVQMCKWQVIQFLQLRNCVVSKNWELSQAAHGAAVIWS